MTATKQLLAAATTAGIGRQESTFNRPQGVRSGASPCNIATNKIRGHLTYRLITPRSKPTPAAAFLERSSGFDDSVNP